MLQRFLAIIALFCVTGCQPADFYDQTADQVRPGSTPCFCAGMIADRVFFNPDSAAITPEARAMLDKQAAWLAKYATHQVIIEGHTDARGKHAANQALGLRRAQAVRDYFIAAGIQASRLEIVSYGQDKPALPGKDAKERAENRRVVVVVDDKN